MLEKGNIVMKKYIQTPLTKEIAKTLKSGDEILLSGIIYTSRDAGHKRLVELLEKGEKLPVDLENQIIYFVGPTPAKEGAVIGSCGPTTSYRMDAYSPTLIKECGLTGMIGKGKRNEVVISAMLENTAVYFGAIGGAGALIAKCVKEAEVVAFEDLGAEALRKLVVEDMPLTVVIDSFGENLYETGTKNYLENRK